MAENTNGRGEEGQTGNGRSAANGRSRGKTNISNDLQQPGGGRQADMGRFTGRRRTEGRSGIATKDNFGGSDYDGHLSDE